jgi:hypothetical protein
MKCLNRPWDELTWDRTPLGLEPSDLLSRALRWLGGDGRTPNPAVIDEGLGAAPGG